MEDINYQAVLTDLKRRRAELDAAISAIEQFTGSVVTGASEGAVVESDSFFGMSVLDAAKKFLRMRKRPQAAPDIARALESGGFTHQSKDFAQTIYTTLFRVWERDGSVVKLPDKKWALGEWYGPLKPRSSKDKDRAEEQIAELAEPEPAPGEEPIDFAAASGRSQPS